MASWAAWRGISSLRKKRSLRKAEELAIRSGEEQAAVIGEMAGKKKDVMAAFRRQAEKCAEDYGRKVEALLEKFEKADYSGLLAKYGYAHPN